MIKSRCYQLFEAGHQAVAFQKTPTAEDVWFGVIGRMFGQDCPALFDNSPGERAVAACFSKGLI